MPDQRAAACRRSAARRSRTSRAWPGWPSTTTSSTASPRSSTSSSAPSPQIGEVTDAADVPPTTHAVPVENVIRPDVVRPSLPREVVLAGAPAAEDGRFRVPRILDDEA